MWNLWNDLLSEQDKAVIRAAGYDRQGAASWDSRSLGRRPALLVIDMQHLLVGPDRPILEAIDHYRTAMGRHAWQAIPAIQALLAVARAARLPVFYTRVLPDRYDASDEAVQIVPALAPQNGEIVIDKTYSSAFYGTDLLTRLVQLGVDTLILTGNSTSGCVRATAVDARQHGFHPLVPVECVFDRIQASHCISLLDLWMKYAVVQPLEEVRSYLDELPAQGEKENDGHSA